MYCNYLLTTRVTALKVVRTTSFQHSFISGLPRPCYFPLPPMVLTLYMYNDNIMCNLRGLNLQSILYSLVNYRQQMEFKNWSL